MMRNALTIIQLIVALNAGASVVMPSYDSTPPILLAQNSLDRIVAPTNIKRVPAIQPIFSAPPDTTPQPRTQQINTSTVNYIETSSNQTPRDTFSINSGYFSEDYANNIDYVQFLLDESRAIDRVALWGYKTHLSVINTSSKRISYLLATNLFSLFTNTRTSYHEWGHASRAFAMGGGWSTIQMFESQRRNL
jgi:hypothetical protein